MKSERNTISIDSKFYNLISDRIKTSDEFSSVDEYVDYVLSELLDTEKQSEYTEEERKEIEKHLKDLGYM